MPHRIVIFYDQVHTKKKFSLSLNSKEKPVCGIIKDNETSSIEVWEDIIKTFLTWLFLVLTLDNSLANKAL